ncbi:hypothetical protein PRZ48_008981 [Zasmidium cellare]|uniref:F-box domain-containing protein n=1 Tax=Zasmidium cellare TaxID=395010 RepID=A0ABR0EHF2_ZASCE|nr:hypothetical protein PRZ48_008981 [Zasmidium cellare]
MANEKRKATSAPAEEPTPKRGRDWRPRTRQEKRVEFSQPVLGTAELFENILLRLPMTDLFVLKRVCKVWRDAIQDSPSLRKKMFIQPCAPPLQPVPNDSELEMMKYLYRSAVHMHPAAAISSTRPDSPPEHTATLPAHHFGQMSITALVRHSQHFVLLAPNMSLRAPGSWEDTLICQPPPVAIGLVAESDPEDFLDFEIHKISNADGITWGDVQKSTKDYMEANPARKITPDCFMFLDDASQTAEIQEAWKYCKGHKDCNGKCGCVWLLQEEQEYE